MFDIKVLIWFICLFSRKKKKKKKKKERGFISGPRAADGVLPPNYTSACSDPQRLQKLCAKAVRSGSAATRVPAAVSLRPPPPSCSRMDSDRFCLGEKGKKTAGTSLDGLFLLFPLPLLPFDFLFGLPPASGKHVGQLSDLPWTNSLFQRKGSLSPVSLCGMRMESTTCIKKTKKNVKKKKFRLFSALYFVPLRVVFFFCFCFFSPRRSHSHNVPFSFFGFASRLPFQMMSQGRARVRWQTADVHTRTVVVTLCKFSRKRSHFVV